jgi:hypothetical protein
VVKDGVVWRSDGRVEGETYKATKIQDRIEMKRSENVSVISLD